MCAVQTAQAVPFHAEQCPQCQHYAGDINRCWAFAVESLPRPLLAYFSGQATEACEKFERLVAAGDQALADKPLSINDRQPATASQAATIPQPRPIAAQITCHKCKSANPTNQERCQSCDANLLPGEGFGQRIAYFIAGVGMAAAAVWVMVQVLEGSPTFDLACFNPVFLALFALGMFFGGIYKSIAPTPKYTRYADRSARHLQINLAQALADINAAIAVAPKNEQAGLLKKRLEINTKLGAEQAVLRDQLNLTLDPENYSTGATVATLLNLDGGAYAGSAAKSDRQALVNNGQVIAFGFCKKCGEPVELNSKLKCPNHGGVQAVQYTITGEEALGINQVMQEMAGIRKAARKRRNANLVGLVMLIGGCLMITYFINKSSQKSTPSALPVANLQSTRAADAISTQLPALADQPAAVVATIPILFSDHQASFEYPSNWQVFDDAGVQTLLRGTLKGIGDWEYIGGVYTGSPDDCLDCAHLVVYMVPLPAEFEGWSDEFYERIKNNAENSMGSRLLLHQQVQLEDFPGWETIYLGKSGNTKLWDKGILPAGEGLLVMVSASANPDHFDQFLPIFQHAFATLSLYGASEAVPAATSEKAPTQAQVFEGVVKSSSVKVRSGPGTTFDQISRMPSNTEFTIVGRNEAADWLKIITPDGVTGWVSAELVTVPVAIEGLPIEN